MSGLINLGAVRTVDIRHPNGQLYDRLSKILLKFFPDLSRIRTVLPYRPDGRTIAARNFHIKASRAWTRGKIIRTVDLMHAISVSILASFCVWTKSLVCNDAPQGFYYSEMLQSQKIFSSPSAIRTIEPSRPDDHLSLFHPSG
jgi:hypothetical protein